MFHLSRTFYACATVLVLSGLLTSPVFAQKRSKPTLVVGSSAPPLSVGEWLKGKPVTIRPGTVYVIEFWASWCVPCRKTVPYLTETAKKYAGSVEIVGVSIGEKDKDPVGDARQFAVVMNRHVGYTLARDDAKHTMETKWMDAAGLEGIPAAIIIDRSGRVSWIGYTEDGLDEAIDKALARSSRR